MSGTTNGMSMERLRELAMAYGGDLTRWPASERGAAEVLLARSHDARACIEEAVRLDSVLAGASSVEPSPTLLRAVAEIPIRHARSDTAGLGAALLWPFGRLRNVFALAVATAAMGLLVGVATPLGSKANEVDAVSRVGRDAVDAADATDDDLETLGWSDEIDEELSP